MFWLILSGCSEVCAGAARRERVQRGLSGCSEVWAAAARFEQGCSKVWAGAARFVRVQLGLSGFSEAKGYSFFFAETYKSDGRLKKKVVRRRFSWFFFPRDLGWKKKHRPRFNLNSHRKPNLLKKCGQKIAKTQKKWSVYFFFAEGKKQKNVLLGR